MSAPAISRRQLLVGTTSLAAAAVLAPGGALSAAQEAVKPRLIYFAVGTPGEDGWQAIKAATPEEAFAEWASEYLYDEEEITYDPECVMRVPEWDDLETVEPADWFRAGFGHYCTRCDYETDWECGGRIVGREVVCEDCLTTSDRAICEPDRLAEDLADKIAHDGADEVREWLEECGHWEAIQGDVWDRAIALAEAK